MDKDHEKLSEEEIARVAEYANRIGLNHEEECTFLLGMEKRKKTSLREIADKNLPKILKHNPNLLRDNGIDIPSDLEEYICSIYISYGVDLTRKATESAKINLEFISYCLDSGSPPFILSQGIKAFKNILDGKYEVSNREK